MERFYPIGTPGQPWTGADKAAWLKARVVERSYRDEVLDRLERLDARFVVEPYGALSIDPARYPLCAVRSARPVEGAPWGLITGGVHGYETSGVQGALAFLDTLAPAYADRLNLLVAPCVSPWGYEVIHRWNAQAIDPNRSFVRDSAAEESAALMRLVGAIRGRLLLHIDLHETTDSDEQEFRPALAARDGEPFEPGIIPDGFYTVADSENPQPAFQAAIVTAVEAVTHIAPPDAEGQIIGVDVSQPGVIHYAFKAYLQRSTSGGRRRRHRSCARARALVNEGDDYPSALRVHARTTQTKRPRKASLARGGGRRRHRRGRARSATGVQVRNRRPIWRSDERRPTGAGLARRHGVLLAGLRCRGLDGRIRALSPLIESTVAPTCPTTQRRLLR